MSERSDQLRCEMGALLLKLHRGRSSLPADEQVTAKMLIAKNLARFVGPEPVMKIGPVIDGWKNAQAAASSYYELTGEGELIVAENSEAVLVSGRFLLPGDPRWHDKWWAKLIPAVIAKILGLK